MKNGILFIFMGILATLISCEKENCIKCQIIGNWNIKETRASFVNGSMTTEQTSNYIADFYENGKGIYKGANDISQDSLYWSVDPSATYVFVSLDILSDTLNRTEQFEIIEFGSEKQLWRNEQIINQSTLKLTWELSKI